MNHETQQPYFTVRVTRCGECPKCSDEQGCLAERSGSFTDRIRRVAENYDGLTPSCPLWAQRVEPPKD